MSAADGAGFQELAKLANDEQEALHFDGGGNTPTAIESVPMFEADLDTDRHEINAFPGYEPGFAAGWKRGMACSLEALRAALIAGGTDPGTASEIAERVGRAASASTTDPVSS
jgi:hypothetical protein